MVYYLLKVMVLTKSLGSSDGSLYRALVELLQLYEQTAHGKCSVTSCSTGHFEGLEIYHRS